MGDQIEPMKKFGMSLNLFIYGRLKQYAKENGMSIRSAIRYIINQFFKDKPFY
jgi:macrodomain Ter protein organizer (MatP/YcbG family)